MSLPMLKAYYTARATSTPITFGMSQNNNLQVAVEFEITQDGYQGEFLTWIGTLGGKAVERHIEGLQTAGWQGDDLSELEGRPGSDVLTEEVSLACDTEHDDEGNPRLRANWINRVGGRFAFKEQVSGNDLKAFSAQMKATVRSVRAQGGAPRKSSGGGSSSGGARTQRSQQPHPNAPGGGYDREPHRPDEDIPF